MHAAVCVVFGGASPPEMPHFNRDANTGSLRQVIFGVSKIAGLNLLPEVLRIDA